MTDQSNLDLSPRTTEADERRPSAARRWLVVAIVAVLLVGGFFAVKALAGASVFFYTVDEAVAQHAELGTERFRLEGQVVPDSVTSTPEGVQFAVSNGDAVIEVDHVGDPPQLFADCIPVVLEGRFTDATSATRFSSDVILVKHSPEYEEDNAERIDEAHVGAGGCPDVMPAP